MPEVKVKLKILNKSSKPPFLFIFVPTAYIVPPSSFFVTSHHKPSWCLGKEALVFSMTVPTVRENSALQYLWSAIFFLLLLRALSFCRCKGVFSRGNLQPAHISYRRRSTYKLRTLLFHEVRETPEVTHSHFLFCGLTNHYISSKTTILKWQKNLYFSSLFWTFKIDSC